MEGGGEGGGKGWREKVEEVKRLHDCRRWRKRGREERK